MSSDDEQPEFESTDAGASKTVPMQAGNVKKNGHMMIKDHPCRVVDISTSKTGKHGHAKANIVGIDIFTGKKYEDCCPTSHNISVPIIERTEYQLLDVSADNHISLLMSDGTTKDDLDLPKDSEGNLDEIATMVKQAFEDGKNVLVAVINACGTEKVIGMKDV